MRAGDHVLHRPTGETWVLAAVDGEDVLWAGWPPGRARLADCELLTAATDAVHRDMVDRCRDLRGDSGELDDRARVSRRHECPVCTEADKGLRTAGWIRRDEVVAEARRRRDMKDAESRTAALHEHDHQAYGAAEALGDFADWLESL